MKKKLSLILALVLCVSLCACGLGLKEVKLGETVEKGIAQITIKDVTLGNSNYVKANKTANDFLSPIAKDDLDAGDRFLMSTNEDDGSVVITAIVENVGKNDLNIYPFKFVVNYDNGNEYSSDECYAQLENGEWKEFDTLSLEKVTSGAVEMKIVVWVPNVIIDDNASLTLDFYDFTYKIR